MFYINLVGLNQSFLLVSVYDKFLLKTKKTLDVRCLFLYISTRAFLCYCSILSIVEKTGKNIKPAFI